MVVPCVCVSVWERAMWTFTVVALHSPFWMYKLKCNQQPQRIAYTHKHTVLYAINNNVDARAFAYLPTERQHTHTSTQTSAWHRIFATVVQPQIAIAHLYIHLSSLSLNVHTAAWYELERAKCISFVCETSKRMNKRKQVDEKKS